MGLNVMKFYEMKPKLPFRFDTRWFTGLFNSKFSDNTLPYTVKSITLPKYDIENSNGYSNFGDVRLFVPTFSPGGRKLEITFEETNYMTVSNFLTTLLSKSYSKKPWHITIVITQYNEHFYKSSSKAYVCHLLSYEEPSFKRDGQAQSITMSATFIVDTVIDDWKTGMATYTGIYSGILSDEFNSEIKSLVVNEENKVFKFGNLQYIPNNYSNISSSIGGQNGGKSRADYALEASKHGSIQMNTNAGKMSESERKKLADELSKARTGSMTSNSGIKENNADTILEQAEKSNNPEAFLKNAQALQKHLSDVQKQLDNSGIKFSINCYAGDANQHTRTSKDGNATHDAGAKADISFTRSNGEKITSENATVEEMNMIHDVLAKNGLVMQLETTNKNDSGWGDVALQTFYGMGTGNARQDAQFRAGGSDTVFNSTTKQYTNLKHKPVTPQNNQTDPNVNRS